MKSITIIISLLFSVFLLTSSTPTPSKPAWSLLNQESDAATSEFPEIHQINLAENIHYDKQSKFPEDQSNFDSLLRLVPDKPGKPMRKNDALNPKLGGPDIDTHPEISIPPESKDKLEVTKDEKITNDKKTIKDKNPTDKTSIVDEQPDDRFFKPVLALKSESLCGWSRRRRRSIKLCQLTATDYDRIVKKNDQGKPILDTKAFMDLLDETHLIDDVKHQQVIDLGKIFARDGILLGGEYTEEFKSLIQLESQENPAQFHNHHAPYKVISDKIKNKNLPNRYINELPMKWDSPVIEQSEYEPMGNYELEWRGGFDESSISDSYVENIDLKHPKNLKTLSENAAKEFFPGAGDWNKKSGGISEDIKTNPKWGSGNERPINARDSIIFEHPTKLKTYQANAAEQFFPGVQDWKIKSSILSRIKLPKLPKISLPKINIPKINFKFSVG